MISGDLIRLYTSYRIFVKLRLFNKIIKHTGLHIYIHKRTTIDVLFITMRHDGVRIPYVYTKSIYTHVSMKYLTNYNFVLIILKLLTINIKGNAIHIFKKKHGWIITHTTPPPPLFLFQGFTRMHDWSYSFTRQPNYQALKLFSKNWHPWIIHSTG